MKHRLASLLFAYLNRMGLVLCAVDPSAPAPVVAGGDPAGAANDGTVNNDDAGGGDEGGNDGGAAQDDREKTIRKLERRIGTRTRALGERDATIAQLRAELAQMQGGGRGAADPADDDHDDADAPRGTRREPAVDVDALANQRAIELRRREKVAERTSAMLKEGAKLDPKFRDLALDVAADLPFVVDGKPSEFIEEVLDTDKPADLLLYLTRNPDAVESLQGLTGAKLGRRIEKLVAELAKAPAQPSNAPRPLEPVGGRGNSAKADKAMTDEEWRASRRAA